MMSQPLGSGVFYGLFAFMLGFVLGTARVLLLAPTVGPTLAVLIELPLMLAACWWWSGRIARRIEVERVDGAHRAARRGAEICAPRFSTRAR
ncbi:MAG: hypothetical protein K2X31_11205, partial [Sphingopyxis sp.]|nr:hypothetical protein [Sphingopyxis sp.]